MFIRTFLALLRERTFPLKWPSPYDFEAEEYPYTWKEKIGFLGAHMTCKLFKHCYFQDDYNWWCLYCGSRHPDFIFKEDGWGNIKERNQIQ